MEINNLPSQWRMALIRQIKIIKKHFQEGSSILEIGCGQGLLLEELKKYFNVIGVEPSISASKISRLKGVETITGYFQDVVNNELKDKKFNLVIVSHVVEHIKDYSSFIDQILKILSNNGQILFIQTNYLGLMPRYLKSDWYAWVPEQHYWHFTPNGLTYILEKKGLTVKKIEYSSLAHGNIISFSYLIIPQTGDQFHLLAGL
jgi:2-polyprenyl-3-methyl-5-hydroxy-6-metoxy-1,4-benzoquinol methylase